MALSHGDALQGDLPCEYRGHTDDVQDARQILGEDARRQEDSNARPTA
jgi:hypothetical protein